MILSLSAAPLQILLLTGMNAQSSQGLDDSFAG